MSKRIATIVGSLRRESNSRRIAAHLPALAPAGTEFHELAIGELPLYNGDLEELPAWKQLRDGVRAADGIVFITPEYNRSIPAGIKNAIDIASKPNGMNLWPGKPALVMAQSSGPLGGLAGSFALKQALAGAGALTMPHPEVYLSRVATLFDAEGKLVPDTQEFLRGVLAKFDDWVERNSPRRQP
ncbi:NADPH-dependent FMN reductase [Ramlibacter albus]|uniref:NAD(P)H-dependent oxidoreductase n=1 Tax=Ramlibacter albus TaxID=2079448 RepID=A0A923S4Y0_9BURK|nr:NAD(P)H-dependent oxidoreductase [Ramlibacter albus]MBC5767946.1 NAD(P)H-dependent oxidoreductase [Ramlibacter albus]